MWQKCPICNGKGNSWQPYINEQLSICKICDGKGIISELTGLPPKGVETFASPKYRNPDGTPISSIKIKEFFKDLPEDKREPKDLLIIALDCIFKLEKVVTIHQYKELLEIFELEEELKLLIKVT